MKESKQLLLANRAWATEITDEDPEFFTKTAQVQRPKFLWIGCSDSRVAPELITQVQPGGMFIHRNIANQVNLEDMNLMSVVQSAIDRLDIPNIIVCGHHGCGGLKAAMEGGTTGAYDRWIEHARKVVTDHRAELDAQPSDERKLNRLVEVNVRDQLVNLAKSEPVAAAFAAGKNLTLHGWVYDMRNGFIRPLMKINRTTDLTAVDKPERVLLTTQELEAELAA